MDHVTNFRTPAGIALPGGHVRDGCLYRSGHLGDASKADLERLEALGIRTIVDLRSDHDIASEGSDRIPSGATHHHIPIEDDAGRGRQIRELVTGGDIGALRAAFGDGKSLQIATYGAVNFVTDPSLQARFAEALSIVLDPDSWPVLWHCSAGKDRAGWVGTIALLAAGADRRAIVDHYVESNDATNRAFVFPEGEMRDLLQPFLQVRSEYVNAQLDEVTNRWGSVELMLTDGLGLAPETVQRFQESISA